MGHKICCIVCNDFQWPEDDPRYKKEAPLICCLQIDGETGEGFRSKLDGALGKLPFQTTYWHVLFSPAGMTHFLEEMEVTEVVDFPGAPTVKFTVSFQSEKLFFLPRDLKTGEFTDIEKQVRCLTILKHPAAR